MRALCEKASRERLEVSNLADYYIVERIGGRLYRPKGQKPMLFWTAYGRKQGLNCGLKTPRFFVVDANWNIISTIDYKVKTMPFRRMRRAA
jgi:hypothetical protein